MDLRPLVSAIIPTCNRPILVCRAIQSVLNQTYKNIEIVVVVDGPDKDTVASLEQFRESPVRIVALPLSVGGSEARNIGVRESRGEWIAFLDDDDEWLPEKTARQLKAAQSISGENFFLSCRYLARSERFTGAFPTRLPDPNERIDEYLCCPRGLRRSGELLQTSTLFVPRTLMLLVPFVRGLKRGQDFMWMIMAGTLGGARFRVLPEVLSVFYSGELSDDRRISASPNWQSFFRCVQENRRIFTSRAYAFCIAGRVLRDALRCQASRSQKLALLNECVKKGSPNLRCLVLFAGRCLLSVIIESRDRECMVAVNENSARGGAGLVVGSCERDVEC